MKRNAQANVIKLGRDEPEGNKLYSGYQVEALNS